MAKHKQPHLLMFLIAIIVIFILFGLAALFLTNRRPGQQQRNDFSDTPTEGNGWKLQKERAYCTGSWDNQSITLNTVDPNNVDACYNQVMANQECGTGFEYDPTSGHCDCMKKSNPNHDCERSVSDGGSSTNTYQVVPITTTHIPTTTVTSSPNLPVVDKACVLKCVNTCQK